MTSCRRVLFSLLAFLCFAAYAFAQGNPPAEKQGKCATCKGAGITKCKECEEKGVLVLEGNCEICSGTGKVQCQNCAGTGKIKCAQCNGTGKVKDERLNREFGCQACGGERSTQSKGAGVVPCPKCARGVVQCPSCKGAGKKTVLCPSCEGAGKVECPTCVEQSYAPEIQAFRNQNSEALQQLLVKIQEAQVALKTKAKRVSGPDLTLRQGGVAMTFKLVVDRRFGKLPTKAEVIEAVRQLLISCAAAQWPSKVKFIRVKVKLLDYSDKGKEKPEEPLATLLWDTEAISDIVWDAPVVIDIERFAEKKSFYITLE